MTAPGAFDTRFARRRQRRAAVDQKLLEAILQTVDPWQSIMDLGAGTGEMVRALRDAGRRYVSGVDGTPGILDLTAGVVHEADLTAVDRRWPVSCWAICLEVIEHIPAEHHSLLFENIAASATVGLILSVAVPGQRGRGHVSCRTPEFIACEFGHRGYRLDEEATDNARRTAGHGWSSKLLVLRRRFPCS